MPCYRCGARQVDPARGTSPWKRGVLHREQVLVCPDCQRGRDWAGDLDHCARCGSSVLVRRLGETSCRSCGAVGGDRTVDQPVDPSVHQPVDEAVRRPVDRPVDRPHDRGAALAGEVAAALDRVLGREADIQD
jgi:hypothetical protein